MRKDQILYGKQVFIYGVKRQHHLFLIMLIGFTTTTGYGSDEFSFNWIFFKPWTCL